MARRYAVNPANPDIFGEDMATLAEEAIGVGLAAVVTDRVTGPLAKQIVPGASSAGSLMGKVIDAAATAVTGWLNGEIVSLIDGRFGSRVKRGGVLLAVAKGIAAIVPGYSPLGPLPVPSWLGSFQPPAKPAAQLPAAGSGTSAIQSSSAAVLNSVGTMGI